jgi:Zn-finger nucleic acid-binding protein
VIRLTAAEALDSGTVVSGYACQVSELFRETCKGEIMQCPKCHGEAPDFNTKEGVVVNFCNDCKGLWFDQGELALYTETAADLPQLDTLLSQGQTTSYTCPHCPDEHLIEIPYMSGEDLLIDWCPGCHGAWLDHRELPKVERLAARHAGHMERLKRGISQLEQAGFTVIGLR